MIRISTHEADYCKCALYKLAEHLSFTKMPFHKNILNNSKMICLFVLKLSKKKTLFEAISRLLLNLLIIGNVLFGHAFLNSIALPDQFHYFTRIHC